MEKIPASESSEFIKEVGDLTQPPTEGIFKEARREQLLRIREAIQNDPQLAQYYALLKEKLITENGLISVNRARVYNEMHDVLSTGGQIEQALAKKLEGIAAANI